jgi:tetratricopeptide (TPR) repeat protein
MTLETDDYSSMKRRLILRDTLTFLSLTLITVVLFAVTLFLFRSFAAHREQLAQRWSDRGQAALQSGHPDQAIVALRTALSYAPGERSYELLLAQALGDAGRYEESYNYFLVLWETQPGDGFINLSLARLAARKNDIQTAVNYYRASIYGTWEGDGTVRRREVRLELTRYLIAHHSLSSARTEILIAGGNAPDDLPLNLTLAALLEQADAPRDALHYYQKVLLQHPKNEAALAAAGRLEYESGNLEEARRLLEQAIRENETAGSGHEEIAPDIRLMFDHSERILALAPSNKLPPVERVNRILKARDIAKKRFSSCNAQVSAASGLASPLQDLGSKWTDKEAALSRTALLKDPPEQDATMKLIFETEAQTEKICGAPTGDDALLLLLAKYPKAMEP